MKSRLKGRVKSTFFYIWNTLHELVHLFLGGLFYFYVVKKNFPARAENTLLFLSLLGSILPDIDHLLYFFVYGKKKEYAQIVKMIFHENGFREMCQFIRKNHKTQTGLISHNLLTVMFLVLLAWSSFVDKNVLTFSLSGAMTTHFLMDMVDDLIFLGGLNPNWYLRFGRQPKTRRKKDKDILK